MIYQINKGTVHFGVNDVFENIQFEVNENEKIALVGRNGCGKSTLLKVIAKELELSSGDIHARNDLHIGYLAQTTFADENITVIDEMNKLFAEIFSLQAKLEKYADLLATNYSEEVLETYSKIQMEFELKNGYTYQQELETVFTKFGFDKSDLNRKISEFSGGQKTRLAFVKLLISKPDVLLLDEPTNHLDLKTIEWLEGYLKKYPKAIILVSHDRYFLDNVSEITYELEYGHLTKYMGNYSFYREQKKADMLKQQSAYYHQQKEIERLEGLIEKFRYKKSKASFAQSKIKYLDKMEKIDKVTTEDSKSFNAHFIPRVKGGERVLKMQDLTIGYNQPLVTVNLEIFRNNKVCIMGDNGTGKSTLLKTLMGFIPALAGNYLFGHQIEVGYFDQQLAQIDSNKTVLEEIWDDYPDYDHTAIRKVLGSFLFSADDVFKQVAVLSGGEKVRLTLAKLVLKQPNFLILDEPTNHLDIVGKEALEEALQGYQGTVLFVSHDRYFIKKIATSTMVLENGEAKLYKYGYGEYVEALKQAEIVKTDAAKKNKAQSKPVNNRNQIKRLEDKISKIEEELAAKRALRFEEEYYHDYQKMDELNQEIDDLVNEYERNIKTWEELLD